MWFRKLSGRVIPILALGLGTATAGDPVSSPKSSKQVASLSVVASQAAELPNPKTLTPEPKYKAPVEAGPTTLGDIQPPPMPLPEGAGFPETSYSLVSGMPLQPGLAYARAEYLFWNLSGGSLPVLARTGPVTSPIGVPGFPGETVLFGGDNPLQDPRSGARLTFGTWLDCTRTIGVEASGFWLDQQSTNFVAGSVDGSAVVSSSPFIEANTGLPTAVLVSFPDVVAGSTRINYTGRSIWGGDLLARGLLTSGAGWRLDGLIGYRIFNYNEALSINRTIIPLIPLFVPGTTVVSNDQIETENQFNGGAIGLDLQKDYGCWTFNLRPTVAIGRMRNSVIRDGATTISVPGTLDLAFPGGIYNLNSNLGEINSQDWTVIPELDFRVSKTIWNCIRLSVGYSAMYIPSLARAGEQIDPFVNPSLIAPGIPVGPPLPAKIVERSPAWLYGFTFGVEMRF